jgi:hypothetical protein
MIEEIYVTYIILISLVGRGLNKTSQIIVSQSVVSLLIDDGPPPPVASYYNLFNANENIIILEEPTFIALKFI